MNGNMNKQRFANTSEFKEVFYKTEGVGFPEILRQAAPEPRGVDLKSHPGLN